MLQLMLKQHIDGIEAKCHHGHWTMAVQQKTTWKAASAAAAAAAAVWAVEGSTYPLGLPTLIG